MAHQTVSLRVPEDISEQYDELARARGLDRDRLMMDVLREYLEVALQGRRRTLESVAEIERGEFVPVDTIEAEETAWLESQGYTPEQIAAIDRQIDEELRAAYGVAPCG